MENRQKSVVFAFVSCVQRLAWQKHGFELVHEASDLWACFYNWCSILVLTEFAVPPFLWNIAVMQDFVLSWCRRTRNILSPSPVKGRHTLDFPSPFGPISYILLQLSSHCLLGLPHFLFPGSLILRFLLSIYSLPVSPPHCFSARPSAATNFGTHSDR